MRTPMKTAAIALLIGLPLASDAFVPTAPAGASRRAATTLNMNTPPENAKRVVRRTVGHAVAVALATSVVVLAAPSGPALAEELPPGSNPFTSICMGFGCGEFRGLEYGGAPAPTDEDSITFKSFLESLDKGLIVQVEFTSGGNKAYAFVKPAGGGGEPSRIRIGEGYPDEQANGWSSPLWVVRALSDCKIPFHFGYDLGSGQATKTVAK